METNINIKFGFIVDGIYFGWNEGILYQLPYNNNGRYYPLRVLKRRDNVKGWTYYTIRRKKVGIEKIRAMLQSVNWNVTMPINI